MSEVLFAAAAGLPLAAGWSVHALLLGRRIEAARRDPLTGLWTRDAFEDRARKLLAKGEDQAVLLLDLDGFKGINDTFGHAAGDAVIRATGMRLGAWAAGCGGVAGRLGGDEFAAVVDAGEGLGGRVLELVGSIERPVLSQGRMVDVSVSVGVARWPRRGGDLSTLLRVADEQMYEVKREGGGAWIAPDAVSVLPTVNGRRFGRSGTTGREGVR
ncbi:GGDEF domain-containing protein [Streptomyces acidiscabies]|uniref:GGDEF domain-containing protein n=1 Tax=Streptomyces acidiscabies TaxID=42234 RepID=A0ABU4LPZ5_9ACTN|nr:GGDEF domain-containing protein [Streptomyces acidiscabies]MDX3017349.1 GGDEF domain-containing protein [Streptomyces acidiscabies]